MAGRWQIEPGLKFTFTLSSLASKLFYMFVALLRITNVLGLSFLFENKTGSGLLLLRHYVLHLVLLLLKHSLSFIVNCLSICQHLHWDVSSSGLPHYGISST